MVNYQSTKVNLRTRAMLAEVERLCGFTLTITQGKGTSVSASGGTHDGYGVVDIRTIDLNNTQRSSLLLHLRQVGFAAWLRNPTQGKWPYHCHAVAIGEPDLSPAAKNQVTDYRQNRNGLANNGPDDGPRQFIYVTWEKYQASHLPPEDDEMTPAQMTELKKYIDARQSLYSKWLLVRTLQAEYNAALAGKASSDVIAQRKYDYELAKVQYDAAVEA